MLFRSPVARTIERELQAPELPSVVQTLAQADLITLHWMRDCWQAMSRLKILEGDIAPTPLTLDQLTPDAWRQALTDAQQCLDAGRDHRGRGRQVVTTAASRTQGERDVSPLLRLAQALHVFDDVAGPVLDHALGPGRARQDLDRKSTRLNSSHT